MMHLSFYPLYTLGNTPSTSSIHKTYFSFMENCKEENKSPHKFISKLKFKMEECKQECLNIFKQLNKSKYFKFKTEEFTWRKE